jgi:AcrR family transcriptional regulator
LPRPPEPERREALEERLVDYVLEHGAAGFSLRPASRALGVSTYALTYHFGSRDRIIAVALTGAEQRQQKMVRSWAEDAQPSPGMLLRRYWQWALTPEGRRHQRLFFEVASLALSGSATEAALAAARAPAPWLELLRELLRPSGLRGLRLDDVATRMTATITGLAFDLLVTGDARRTTRTLEAVADEVDRIATARRA